MYNSVIASGVLAWLVAQIIKTVLYAVKSDKVVYERLVGAGGMPSSHTSMVIASLIAVGRAQGISSTVFGVMFIFACIVIYDAMGVRYAAGQHAKALNKINDTIFDDNVSDTGSKQNKVPKKLKELLGHTPLDVVGGAIVGIIIGILIPVKG